VDVVLLRWPAEAIGRGQLADRQVPRHLVIEEEVVPPEALDCLEDWIRMPAPEVDVRARIAALAVRAGRHLVTSPTLDADGVLRCRGTWVPLPAVVSRDRLTRAGWPQGAPGRNALDVHVLRLRRRIDPPRSGHPHRALPGGTSSKAVSSPRPRPTARVKSPATGRNSRNTLFINWVRTRNTASLRFP